jgi:hypothetical protein
MSTVSNYMGFPTLCRLSGLVLVISSSIDKNSHEMCPIVLSIVILTDYEQGCHR